MNPRERFLASMHFEPVDRCPLWEWGPWGPTVKRWQAEGMVGDNAPAYAECDPRPGCGVNFGMVPGFEKVILEQTDDRVLYIDERGVKQVELLDRQQSMPHWLDFPLKTPADWLEMRKRYDPASPERYPKDLKGRVDRWHADGLPVVIGQQRDLSFFGAIRGWMGAEGAMVAFYDQPALVGEMMEFLADFHVEVLRRALDQAPVDYVVCWEDMAYKTASLISPKMFREYMLPGYKKLADMARSRGIDVIFVDSDGNVEELIPLWLEAGVNGVYPMEVQSGMDVVELRAEYGKDLLMMGGLDKRVLAWGQDKIDAELERKLPVAASGGYIPTIDHSLPPDIPYANFLYYWQRKKHLLGVDAG